LIAVQLTLFPHRKYSKTIQAKSSSTDSPRTLVFCQIGLQLNQTFAMIHVHRVIEDVTLNEKVVEKVIFGCKVKGCWTLIGSRMGAFSW